MEKLINKILSMRGPEYRPFAIEVAQDEIRLSVYGGARGFDEPSTASTASHSDLDACLLEGIELLEHARLLSSNRAPYHRLPHHRCVFRKRLVQGGTVHEVRRRAVLRSIPRHGEWVRFGAFTTAVEDSGDPMLLYVHSVLWNIHDDVVEIADGAAFYGDGGLEAHLAAGWTHARELQKPEIS